MTTVSHTPAGVVLRIERGRRWAWVEVDRIPLMTLAPPPVVEAMQVSRTPTLPCQSSSSRGQPPPRRCASPGCGFFVRPPAVRCPLHRRPKEPSR